MTAPPTSPRAEQRPRGILIVLLASLFWSTSGLFISLILQEGGVTPVGIAFWRDLLTFSVLFSGIFLFRRDLLRVDRGDMIWLALMGSISIGLFHFIWNLTIQANGVAVATVLQSNAPMVVALVAWFLWREPLTSRKLLAIFLAFVGTVFIGRIDNILAQQVAVQGLLLGLFSSLLYGMMSIFGKKLAGSYTPWTILVYIFGFGALVLLPFQILDGFSTPRTPITIAYFIGMVLLTTIAGFGFYTYSLRTLQASVAAIVATAEVPFATILSYIILRERLDVWQVVGGLLVIAGVVVLSWPQRRLKTRAKVTPVPEKISGAQ